MASEEARRFWAAMRAQPQDDNPSIEQRRQGDEHAEDLSSEPSGVVFTPALAVSGLWAVPPAARPGAAILYFYGGGYVLGSPVSRRKTAGHLALAAQARALVPAYRLAPEHPFPAAIEDAVAAYRWLLADGADAAHMVLAGDSAGGGLALAAALALRDRGLARPAGVVTVSMWGDMTCSGETMESRAVEDICCSRDGLMELAGLYLALPDLGGRISGGRCGNPPDRRLDQSAHRLRSTPTPRAARKGR
jgi:acetyl esterase/lipase